MVLAIGYTKCLDNKVSEYLYQSVLVLVLVDDVRAELRLSVLPTVCHLHDGLRLLQQQRLPPHVPQSSVSDQTSGGGLTLSSGSSLSTLEQSHHSVAVIIPLQQVETTIIIVSEAVSVAHSAAGPG